MKLAVISPPDERPNEIATVGAMFAAGLERYDLRKPSWDIAHVAWWLEAIPARWRGSVFVHSHPDLAHGFRTGAIHLRDDGNAPADPGLYVPRGCLTSRSCHDVAAVKASLGRYDSLLFGPVFPSISKQGHGPVSDHVLADLREVLAARVPAERRTEVLAIGGVTAQRLPRCRTLGFDGVAILGAVWSAADPVAAFIEFQNACLRQTQGDSGDVEGMS